ncbi:replicative helicase loader/inhibitor [Neobacillus bataviensis]|uniref:replicative helicase loader/inhibitor n=1 Tax=Neobacillus bataviensis TaxID=220685 RepID=UPI001CC19CBA|nr:replicative helicase loader/inhibitor [Neobacillus bataviensis]
MIKRETFELLKQIAVFYDQFVVNQEKVNLWHEALKGYSFDEVHQNLLSFVVESTFPPKLADLVKKSPPMNMTPSQEETMKWIIRKPPLASEEVVERHLAEMRKILGIVRGEG